MPRYFFTENARQPLVISGRTYEFKPCGIIGGHLQGILEAADPQAEHELGVYAAQRRGVLEIPEEEFLQLGKEPERIRSSQQSSPLKIGRAVEARLHPAKQGIARSAEERTHSMESQSSSGKMDPDNVIKLGKVNSPNVLLKDSERSARPGSRRRKGE